MSDLAGQVLRVRLARTGATRGIPARPDPDAPAPLSAVQARMRFAAELDPESPAYNVPVGLRLRGPLDTDALLAAVRGLLRRHPVLRSVVSGDTLVVRPVEEVPVTVGTGDCQRDVAVPFRLTEQPPTRVHLYRLGPDEHLLVLLFHHIAVDAWSLRLLLSELAAQYAGQPVAEPAVRYADVTAYQLDRSSPERRRAGLDWWRSTLDGLPGVLALPTDRPRPAVPETAGQRIPVHLPAALADAVRRTAADTGTTVFMVLLGAWQALLARLSGTVDVPVGVISAGRELPGTESVVGCFVDTVTVRTDLSGLPTGRQVLARARQAALDALAHADVPLEEVVEALRPERVAGAHPLFQVLLNVYEDPLDAVTLPGLAVTPVDLETPTAKFDLSLNIRTGAPGTELTGWLVYRSTLFDQSTVESILAWYRELLAGMLAEPDTAVADLPLAAVRGPVLAGGPATPDDRTVAEMITRWIDRTPDATAVVGPDGTLSYRELDLRANAVSRRLLDAGLRPGEPVAVWVERGLELAVGLLGALRAGGGYLPVDPGHPPGRVRAMLAAAGCRHLLTQPALAGTLRTDATVLVLDGRTATDRVAVRGELAYVIFTSGSTGTPKGVAVAHRSIANYLCAVFHQLGPDLHCGRSFALVSTAAADLGLTAVFGALTTGGTLHLVDRETALDPAELGRYLAAHRVDVLKLVPSQLRMLAGHGDLSALLPRRMLILAGEPCPWELVERIHQVRPDLAVQSHYGPTETTVAVLACDVTEVPPARRQGTVPLGRPLAGARLHVVDERGRPVPPGVPGELVIGGPGVAGGYLNQPGLTADRFRPDPTGGPGRCYHTGDRVRVRVDGTIDFLGRTDDQIKIRGYRVELGEIAAACLAVPGVADAAVLPVGQEPQRQLAAWLVPAPGAELAVPAVREALRAILPDHLLPALFTVLAALPRNANGKVDRAALPDPAPAGHTPLGTDTERRIAAVWQAQLGAVEIGADDDFFALGGDSFAAVRAVKAIDPRLRVIDLFTHRTVGTLASYVDGLAEATAGRLLHRLAGPAGGAPLTAVCVPYGGGSAAAVQPFASALHRRTGATVYAVELPGHDPGRPDEPLLPLADLVERCAAELAAIPGPLLVYGHCVGTAATVALARRLEDDGRDLVGVVLAASFPAARLPGRLSALIHRLIPSDRWLSDRSYRDVLTVMGGLEGAQDDGDTGTMLRALRHDAREAEGWFTDALADQAFVRLRAPVLSVVGERDRSTELYTERYREWGAFARQVELAAIPHAAHYFLKHQADELAGIVADRLDRWRSGRPATAAGPQDLARPEIRRGLRTFAVLASGQFVSMVGSQLSAFALGVWVYQRTGSLMNFALLTMLALLPAIAASPLGGALTDRFDRRRVMLCADLTAAAAVGVLAVQLWWGDLRLWQILLAVTVGSLAAAIQRPAYIAATAQLVPKPYLPQANALANLGTGVGTLLGPLAGGVLITTLGIAGVVALDMSTFLVGVATLLAVRFPDRLFRRQEESFGRALSGGWRFIVRRRSMVLMIAFYMPVNFLLAVAMVLVTPLALSVGSAATLGLVTAAGGVGAAVGALTMVLWGGTRRLAHGMIGFTLPIGLATALMGVRPSPVLIGAGLFLYWVSLSILNAHWMSILQIKVGQDLQGRVLAVNQMLATAMMPLGFLTAPTIVRRWVTPLVGADRATAALLVVTGLVLAGWSVLGLAYRPLRRLEDGMPDAVVGPRVADDLDEVQRELDHATTG